MKRCLAVFLCLILIVTMSGCGKKEESLEGYQEEVTTEKIEETRHYRIISC